MVLSLILAPGARSEGVPPCSRVKAEAAELVAKTPVACDEAREVHAAYVKNFGAANEICAKLEAEVAAGPAKLKLGTEDQMGLEILEIKQAHILGRNELHERVNRELFGTPLDNNDPSRIPPEVSSECGTEIEEHVRYRRTLLEVISDFYFKLDGFDETLYQQAQERALPAAAPEPKKTVR